MFLGVKWGRDSYFWGNLTSVGDIEDYLVSIACWGEYYSGVVVGWVWSGSSSLSVSEEDCRGDWGLTFSSVDISEGDPVDYSGRGLTITGKWISNNGSGGEVVRVIILFLL